MLSRWLCAVAFACCAPISGAAEIGGRIVFAGETPDLFMVAYVGRTRAGERITCFSSASPVRPEFRMWDNAARPRQTLLELRGAESCDYRHTEVPPGTYLVYVRVGEPPVAWKVVRVTRADERVRVDFTLDSGETGGLSVEAASTPGELNVRLTPLDDRGRSLLENEDLSDRLGVVEYLEDGRAELDGLREGLYRVELRRAIVSPARPKGPPEYRVLRTTTVTVQRGKRKRVAF